MESGVPLVRVDDSALKALCQRHGILRLSLFGSALRPDFGADSDLDVLVEFAAHCRIGLLGVAAVERELSALFGRTVDLRTPADLSPHFRDDVCRTAALQYAA